MSVYIIVHTGVQIKQLFVEFISTRDGFLEADMKILSVIPIISLFIGIVCGYHFLKRFDNAVQKAFIQPVENRFSLVAELEQPRL